MKLGQRLYLSFGAVVALMVISSAITWLRVSELSEVATEVKTDDVPGAIYYLQLMDEIGDMHASLLDYTAGQEQKKNDFYDDYKEFNEFFVKLRPLESAKQSDREKMAKIEEILNTYKSRAEQEVFSVYKPDVERWAYQFVDEIENGPGQELEDLLDRLKEEEFNDALKTTDIREAVNDDLPGVRYYLEILDEKGDMLAALTEYMIGEVEEQDAFEKDSKTFLNFLELLRPLERKPQEVVNLNRIQTLHNEIYDAAQKVFSDFDPLGKAKAIKSVHEMEIKLYEQLEDILDVSANEEKTDAENAMSYLVEGMQTMMTTLFVITTIAAIVSGIIAFSLGRSISDRINQVLYVSKETASGNLSLKPMDHNHKDEIDGLASASNEMVSALSTLLRSIDKVAKNVDLSSTEIAQINMSIATLSQNSSEQSALIATAIEQMSSTVAEVARQAQDASSNAELARDLANKGGGMVNHTVSEIEHAAQEVQKTADTVTSLGELSAQIGDVIGVIGSIAEQTNLLALNAAIEAARAGEQGRGFAVVADEVRTLAERTTKATGEVASTVQAIQDETNAAVAAMSVSVEQVNNSVALAKEAGTSLGEIVDGAQEIATMIQSIATATEEQTVVAADMAKEITKIDEASRKSLQDTKSAEGAAGKLAGESKELVKLLEKFRLN
ncbi:methyl-accepting chemotaxis protein [Pseudoalteromonas phenolica]|uniref:Methyl-accepting chemotaxis protein n=1 Tax=Pseudoalteromonas phenolica TaxID=161398 RepID=A0A5R9Q182_9GAMM|nr:methyl-accepting chemotaxis protein [Pseudoalteromonas phenolica]TLX46695.1 methyl-accepting chemotaxis protein [Pseudoalteromonas phenolica]